MTLEDNSFTPITVTELNNKIAATLDKEMPSVCFQGEISNLKPGPTGHLYFTVKDESSGIQCLMWKGSVATLKFKPESGMLCVFRGKPSVYRVDGRLQIDVKFITPLGEGGLQKKFQELKAKLEKEGLFDKDRKRAIPFMPRAIGIVTSATGAAVEDIKIKLKARMPQIPVYIVDVRVQGEGSATDIARGIGYLNEQGIVDVMIVGRGGGSLQDLWSFNEEIVVRAIFASKIPVISAVGHEVDITLADLVADVRAPTPTSAAQLVVPERAALLNWIIDRENRIKDYERWLRPFEQRIDQLEMRFDERVFAKLENLKVILENYQGKVANIKPSRIIEKNNEKLEAFKHRLESKLSFVLKITSNRIEAFESRLQGVDPKRILERGYAMVVREDEQKDKYGYKKREVVTTKKAISQGESLKILLKDGEVGVKVS